MLITHYEKAFKGPQWNLSEVVGCSYTVGFLKFIYVLHMTRVNKKLERTRVMVENKGDRELQHVAESVLSNVEDARSGRL